MFGSTYDRPGSPTGCSTPTRPSSRLRATLGTGSCTSRRLSPQSVCAIGLTWVRNEGRWYNLCVISHEATCGPLLFNIKEGRTLIPDPEGDDLPDESAAYREI